MASVFLETPKRLVDVTIDGATVRVPEGATLLEACRSHGVDTPTLCYLENLTPVNVCRVCVVEVEGSRTLVPACSRKAEPGMTVRTDSDRVQDLAQDGPRVPRLHRRYVPGLGRRATVAGRLRLRPRPVRPARARPRGRGAGRRPARASTSTR